MRKTLSLSLLGLAAGTLAITPVMAHQSSPAAAPQSSSAQSSAPKSSSKTATSKTGSSATHAKKPAVPLTLKTDKDKASYAIGLNMGKTMRRDSVDVDPSILLRGMKDGLNDSKTPLLTDEEMRTALVALQAEVRKAQQEKFQVLGETNKKTGDAFLEENKAKAGVVALPSGLQYKILQEGTGPKPTAADTVVCNYRGTLIDNTEFDSSAKHGKPATFPVSGVIKGWTEALQLMPVGSKWQLFIPPDLAYGPRGAGPTIGPNATLIFEVELLSIEPKPEPKAKPEATPPATPHPSANPSSSPAENPAANPNAPSAAPKPVPPPTPTPTPTHPH